LGIEITRFFSFHRIDSFKCSEFGLKANSTSAADQYFFELTGSIQTNLELDPDPSTGC